MRLATRAILIVAALALATAASAQPRPGGGSRTPGGSPAPAGGSGGLIVKLQPEQTAELFSEAGFPSKVIENNKTRMVQTEFWPGDVFSGAIPEVCEKDGSGCRAFKIFVNLGTDSGVDQTWIDAWNNRWLYVHAFKLQNGELLFSWDVPLLTGVTADYVRTSAKLFKAIVDASSDFKP